jgi:two-component system sensor histidine kinase KdpD
MAQLTRNDRAEDATSKVLTAGVSALAIFLIGLLCWMFFFVRRRGVEELLRVSNEAKDQFVGLVSHELRNPITTILGSASILGRRWQHLTDEERLRVVGDIQRDAQRLDRVVANMLILARLEAAPEEFEPILLLRVVSHSVALHHERFPDREVETDVPRKMSPALGDASYVEQVLLNLLGNSEKYGHPTAPICVAVTAVDGEARVSVMDRGEGILHEDMEHLFEPFFRSRRDARRVSGAGLGLPVCQRLVELQGGRMWAEHRTGGGSIFTFTLPLGASIESPSPAEPAPAPPPSP